MGGSPVLYFGYRSLTGTVQGILLSCGRRHDALDHMLSICQKLSYPPPSIYCSPQLQSVLHSTRRFTRLTVLRDRSIDTAWTDPTTALLYHPAPVVVPAPKCANPSPPSHRRPPTLAATGHRPTVSRMAAASPDTRRHSGRTSAATAAPQNAGGGDDESGGADGEHMQVRHANDAELRRGSRFQRVVCSETRRWTGRGAAKRRGWALEDGGWMFASFCVCFFVGFVSTVITVYTIRFVLLDAYCVDGSGDGDRVGEGAEPVGEGSTW